MEITIAELQATIAVAGRFDANETEAFDSFVSDLVDANQCSLAIELSQVNFIDSTALASLVTLMKRCRERGGDLVLVDPSEPLRVILELTALDQAFTVILGDGNSAAA